jgi:hypothetical protein
VPDAIEERPMIRVQEKEAANLRRKSAAGPVERTHD